VAVAGVLDRQLVQIELLLHRGKLFRRRVAQRQPDETVGLSKVIADLAKLDVGQLSAVLVGDAVDKHAMAYQRSVAPKSSA
jgi:hypothetical protein